MRWRKWYLKPVWDNRMDTDGFLFWTRAGAYKEGNLMLTWKIPGLVGFNVTREGEE